jgi:2-hydroxychromene-2-carboxylate isomerase
MLADMAATQVRFWFDPVCPFCWLTSKWLRMVQEQRDLSVEWRFISLRLINEHLDYAAHFPPEYEAGHTAGLRLLRVAARTRAEHGNDGLDALQAALGHAIFDSIPMDQAMRPSDEAAGDGPPGFLVPALRRAGLPAALAEAFDDDSFDAMIRAEGEEALAVTGKDVGTPIIQIDPPDGMGFFGPVISRLPEPDRAGELWDHVIGLTSFPGFAELKRSLRELPQLVALGVEPGSIGQVEDWHAGSRRTKR